MSDDVYDPRRAEALAEMLRTLAIRITELDASGRLLDAGPELLRSLGDIRSELFQYEVRHTFDSPETAERRRIVLEASQGWEPDRDNDDQEEDGWQHRGR